MYQQGGDVKHTIESSLRVTLLTMTRQRNSPRPNNKSPLSPKGEEEDYKGLMEGDKDNSTTEESDTSESDSQGQQYHCTGFSFNLRYLGFLVFGLLALSHVLLFRQCTVASTKQQFADEPILRRWKVATKHSNLTILSSPKETSSTMNTVQPGQIVETIGHGTENFHQVLEPTAGFLKRASVNTGMHLLTPIEYVPQSSVCPLLYEGWLYEESRLRRYQFAPTPLVMAQQFWNACQIFALFLLIALNYECTTSELTDETLQNRRKWGVRLLSLVGLCILPFSAFLISPGAHIFASVTFGLTMLAIWTPVSVIRLSIGEYDSDSMVGGTTSWTLTREETIACLCNLGSSLYNYAGSNGTWPHWKTHMKTLDNYMGWATHGDVTVERNFTLGLSWIRIPLFVARSTGGSTSGAQIFSIVWSVLPFLYVTYFGCMFVLAPKSPGKHIQRAFCAFGMFHFLFLTDMVSYRYGRGYHTPHGEFCHWSEKWAWRTAMLMPIYQNCTNGHWEHGHRRFPILGKILRYILIVWSVFFFLFQVIQSDVIKFSQFMMDTHQEGLIDRWGFDHTFFFKDVRYPYREALVTMIIMYGALHVTGFTLFRVFVRRQEHGGNSEEDVELQMKLINDSGDGSDDDDDNDDEEDVKEKSPIFVPRLARV